MSSKNVRLVYALDQDAVIDHVFDELSKHHARWPDDRAFVVVPEYLKADMERRYITGQKSQGLMMAEVLSFNRLATRLFTEAGQLALPSISLAGKAVLTQRALLDEQLPFQQFHRLAGRPGYALELVNILGDFTRYRISTDELRHSGTSEDTYLHEATRHKFSDFAILKETLDQSLVEKGLTDPDTALSRLAYLLQETPLDERLHFLRRCHIWVIGFGNNRELTSQELSVIHALSEQVSEMTVALSADSLNPEGDPAWQHGRETLRSLVRMFPEAVPESLEGPFQTRKPEVRFIRAVDRREEARYAAGEIRRLLLSGTVRRREIGIALCETDKTMAYLEPALSEYGIAAAIDSKRPLQNTSFIRMLSAFLLLCEYEFSFEDLIDYLKSGLVPLSLSSVDLFENTALALGWKRARQFRKLAEDELIINDAMARYLDPTSERGAVIREVFAYIRTLLELTAAMRQLRSGREKCRFLLNFLYDEMEVPVTRQRDRLLLEEREENARLLVSSWNAVVDFLTESENLLSDIRISQAHFGKLLSAGIEGLSLPFIPSGVDRVRVGPLNEMVHTPCKILMILGMTDEDFPPKMSREGFLLDKERALLSEEVNKPFPSRKRDHPATQAWLVNNLLNRPEHTLYLSVPSLGEDSSRIYDEELRKYEAKETLLTDYGKNPDPRWYAATVAFRMLRWNKEAPLEWKESIRTLLKELPETARNADEVADEFSLPSPLVMSVMEEQDSVSVSMLQQYNECPFRFFTQYLLNTKERLVADDMPNLQGTMLHRLLELSVSDLVSRLEAARDRQERQAIAQQWEARLSLDFMRPFYQKATEDARLLLYGFPDFAGGVGERLMTRASDTLAMLARFDLQNDYLPRWLEWYFPHSSLEPYLLEAKGHPFTCRGLIDRADESPGGVVRLIDYKRSPKDFSWLDLFDGTDLQMPLYKRAFETAYPDRSVETLLYAGWKTEHRYNLAAYGIGGFDRKFEAIKSLERQNKMWEEGAADHAANFAEHKAQETLEAILSGDFAAKPVIRGTSSNPCKYCPWHSACGFDHRLPRSRPLADGRAEKEMARKNILDFDQGDVGDSQGSSSI